MEDSSNHINKHIVFIGTKTDEAALPEASGMIQVPFLSEKDGMYHTMIIGTTGRGKSVLTDQLEELARQRGYTVEHLEAPGPMPKKPKEPLPSVKIDEYLALPGELFRDAAGCVHDILGCYLTQEGVARFLSESRIGAQILWFNEVETTIGDDMVKALEIFLTGENSWIDSRADYDTRCILMRAAARARGYILEES